MGFFEKLKNGLGKTKDNFSDKLNNVFSTFRKVDEDLLEFFTTLIPITIWPGV